MHIWLHMVSPSPFLILSLALGIITSPTLEQYGLHKSSLVTSYSGTHPFLYPPVTKWSSTQSIPSLPLTRKEQCRTITVRACSRIMWILCSCPPWRCPCLPQAVWRLSLSFLLPFPPFSLSVPRPPSQDCRLPTASRAISMYDKCRVCRQANLVSALPRWGPSLRYHWKIIYRCEERRGKKCQFTKGENDSYFSRPLFFFFFLAWRLVALWIYLQDVVQTAVTVQS